MSQIISRKFEIDTAKSLIDIISLSEANIYLAISHSAPWANDSLPPTVIDAVTSEVGFWRGLIGGKKVVGNDVQLVVPRINWQANTIYSAYSDQYDSTGNNFYVLTSDYNVYKCLSNNASANSTTMPTYTAFDQTHQENDGYVWKYMLTLTTADRQRFLTDDWFPVRKLILDDGSLQWEVQQNAIPGGIHVITVTNPGTNYTNAGNLVITIAGDGAGVSAFGQINAISNTVSNITVSIPGADYHFANVTVSGGGGANATANVIISPFNGHGSDAAKELGARNLMLNIRLQRDEDGKLTVANDYRQIGLLRDPEIFGTSNVMGNTVFSQTFDVQVGAGSGNYSLDEYVFQGGSLSAATFSGRVLDWDVSNNFLRLTETTGTITSSPITGITSGVSRFTINTTNPDVVPYSGTIYYLENTTPIARANDQTESLTTVITF